MIYVNEAMAYVLKKETSPSTLYPAFSIYLYI